MRNGGEGWKRLIYVRIADDRNFSSKIKQTIV